MIVDGRQIAENMYQDLRKRIGDLGRAPVLTIITCAPNFETKKYLSLKKKKAEEVGVRTFITELQTESTTDDFTNAVSEAVSESDGIIVQLPLPESVHVEQVLRTIPLSHDVDGLHPDNKSVLSPVVGAIAEIVIVHTIDVFEKFVTIIGSGRLVGMPAYVWFLERGAHVSVVTKDTKDIAYYTKNADIVVCGAGMPGLLTPEMVREGVAIFDAGTSEDGGELKGDADPACASKATIFTPVPGGIGPITIASLLRNVVDCAGRK